MVDRVEKLILDRCPRLRKETELLRLLRYDICSNTTRKYSFCLNWIADLSSGKNTRELKARALEVPDVLPETREKFVPLLLDVLSDRMDIEVKTEWELEKEIVDHMENGSFRGTEKELREILRIWVIDKYKTKSPFVEREEALQKTSNGSSSTDTASD